MLDKGLQRLEERKSKLVRYICLSERYKSLIVKKVRDLNYLYTTSKITYELYKSRLDRLLQNKAVIDWVNYYNKLTEDYRAKIKDIDAEIKKRKERKGAIKKHAAVGTVSAIALVFMMIGLFAMFNAPAGITGMATQDTLANVTILNIAPNVTDVTISPAAPNTSSNLSCSGTTSDLNLDDITVYYKWFKDGLLQGAFNTSNVSSENTTSGEEWICGMIPYDGVLNGTAVNSSSVTIANTAPDIISAELYPATPYTTDNLILNITCSDDDSADTLTAYWDIYRNSSMISTLSDLGVVANGVEANITVVNSTNTSKHETWIVEAWCGDGATNTSKQNTSSRLIQNMLPTIPTLVSPTDDDDTLFDRNVAFNWTISTDGDGDSIIYELNITSITETDVFKSGLNETNYTLQEELGIDVWYNWSVRAYDGEEYSSWSTVWSFYIPSTIIINLTNGTSDFGSVYNNEVKNTTAGDAYPFVVENIGNVISDIKVRALDGLWTAVNMGTRYFQFMAGNYTSEPGSFNWTGSQITWQNMTNTSSLLVVDKLIYNATNNSAEIELNIKVPSLEQSGSKSSSITVGGVIS